MMVTTKQFKPTRLPWFEHRTAVLATMHRKEQVIAPLFAQDLDVTVVVPSQFNTDAFGTFTRDIQRISTQIGAARRKAHQVLELTGESLAIASEGAFFPHPVLPFSTCDREIVLLVDQAHNLEVVGQILSTQTNFAHTTVKTFEAALAFAQRVGFPDHALVVMPQRNCQDPQLIFKGIRDTHQLKVALHRALEQSPNQQAHIETDMRALYNPSRMQVIQQATQDLINKLKRCCPKCSAPGFEVVEQHRGLPCQWCHLPTKLVRAETYRCQKCNFSQEALFPQGTETADPTYCLHCNP